MDMHQRPSNAHNLYTVHSCVMLAASIAACCACTFEGFSDFQPVGYSNVYLHMQDTAECVMLIDNI